MAQSQPLNKIWLKEYPAGVPAEIRMDEYPNIPAIFARGAERFAKRPAFSNMGKTYTFAEMDEMSLAFAAYCQQTLKLQKGDRIAIMMPNLLQYPVALFGALRAGLVVVNVNPLYTPRELEYQLKDSGAKAIVILQNFAHVLTTVRQSVPVEHVILTELGDLLGFPKRLLVNFVVKNVKKMVPAFTIDNAISFLDVIEDGRKVTFNAPTLKHSDLAFLQYTGGTTGVAKGAMLSHGNIVANMMQAKAWIGKQLVEGQEIIITALPLYHIFSLTANCMIFSGIGALNVLITNPRDMAGFIKELKQWKFTAFTGVNTLFNGLLNQPEFSKVDFSHLKVVLGGGMAVQEAVATRWKKVTGVTLVEAYGLTETSPAACVNPLTIKNYNGYIGLPISSTDVSIRNEQGEDVPVGERGEICIRGPQVMQGYWGKPEETSMVMLPGGWLKTGDVGIMNPQGYIKIVDRLKDMILVSGFNVYPNEIEDVVSKHDGVLEVAAIGVPDLHSGEAVKIFVVKKNKSLVEEELLDYCRKNLTGYKVPKHVEFRDDLPKTNVGKILRRELRSAT